MQDGVYSFKIDEFQSRGGGGRNTSVVADYWLEQGV